MEFIANMALRFLWATQRPMGNIMMDGNYHFLMMALYILYCQMRLILRETLQEIYIGISQACLLP
jgi:hypothetical protein